MTYVMGVGSYGNDVRRLQEYINSELTSNLVQDGSFGGNTKAEVLRFRSRFGLPAAPVFDAQCFIVSAPRGFSSPNFDTDPAKRSLAWPKRQPGLTSPPGTLMQQACGEIIFQHTPVSGNPEHITVTNGYEAANIRVVDIPQLKNCIIPLDPGVTKCDGRVRFHRNHTARLAALFQQWEQAGLMDRILTFDGSFNLRLKRGSTKATVANLSNHSWGTAFDINATWNQRKAIPAMMGDRGCIRELVAIANANGFYWGGHFTTMDGMHFEVAAEFL